MTTNKDFKRLVRARMQKTGEAYTAARAHFAARKVSTNTPAPAKPDYARLAGRSDEIIKARTGCTWERWVGVLDYYGAGGNVQVNGQPCTITRYHLQANYLVPGYRIDIGCTRANKQTYSIVENLSGDYAWDDDIVGAELVPGKGKSTPNGAALTERRIRLWASPHGVIKAALAAAAGMHPLQSFGQNPATLLDRQAAAGVKGTTTLSWVTEKTVEKAVLTFPVPDVPGATATATLVNYLPESVVVKNGNDTHEFIYGKWGDFNNPLFKIEALMPGTTVERKNGAAVRNVTTKVTEIGQIYVIVPVPESVQKAGK